MRHKFQLEAISLRRKTGLNVVNHEHTRERVFVLQIFPSTKQETDSTEFRLTQKELEREGIFCVIRERERERYGVLLEERNKERKSVC